MAREVGREEFGAIFNNVLNLATAQAEEHFGVKVPRRKSVELHGAGLAGDRIAPDAALGAVYLGPTRFHKNIDVAIKWIEGDTAEVWMVVAGFEPCPWEATRDPEGLGPFHLVGLYDIHEPAWHRIARILRRLARGITAPA